MRSLLASFLLLGACATPATITADLNRWVGKPEAELVSKWGPPDKSYGLDTGARVLEWHETRYGGRQCRLTVVVSPKGDVASTAWQGACA